MGEPRRPNGHEPGQLDEGALTIFAQATISWLPGAWFVLMTPFLQNPVYYLVGFASSAFALVNPTKVRKLLPPEPKAAAADGQA